MRSIKLILLIPALLALTSSGAMADVTPKVVTAGDAAKLVSPEAGKNIYDIARTDAFRMALQVRNKTNPAEMHTDWDKEIVIQEGTVLFVYGGEATNGVPSAPGEFRGGTIVGGTSTTMHAGDIIIIPAGTWHQAILQGPVMRDILFRTKH